MSSRKKNQEEEPKEGRLEGDKRKFLALVTRGCNEVENE